MQFDHNKPFKVNYIETSKNYIANNLNHFKEVQRCHKGLSIPLFKITGNQELTECNHNDVDDAFIELPDGDFYLNEGYYI